MSRDRSYDIAVTGVSGRFPGACDLRALWEALKEGRILTRRYARDELLRAGVPPEVADDADYVPVHGHLEGAERFDNALFGIGPREAELLDPQHRMMLEAAWAALEDAAVAPARAPATGVYASAAGSGYLRAMVAGGGLDPLALDDAVHGSEPDFLAGHIAYRLGLDGPAMAVQTACSSSLVAVHTAVQALLAGECDQALVVAAGVPYPQAGYLHVPGGIHSPSGRCRPFDAEADGVVAGSGVVCAVLRRLEDVPRDAPALYGTILGTAVNNDGAAKAGFFAPSPAGQERVIRAAVGAAGISAETIGYLEAHGTGTRLGDPIEWEGASSALAAEGARPGGVAVGALKANIGHLDNAAGLAGLVKALLVLREGVVPPVAGYARMNPLLESEGSPLYVPDRCAPWGGPEPRRAGVSSFGIGGTNAHVVLEAAVPRGRTAAASRPSDGRVRLSLLSAADAGALDRTAAGLARYLSEAVPDPADVARTLATGRAELPERMAVAGRTREEIAGRLAAAPEAVRGRRPPEGAPPVILLFPGQGAQAPGMAAPPAEALPGFRRSLEDCLDAFGPDRPAGLEEALFDPAAGAEALAETESAQPALFAVGYAAAEALAGLGVAPVAVAGHSLGEITAACAAGALSLEDAARFVAARGRAMQGCPEGAMLAMGCGEDRARELMAGSGASVEIAAVNSEDGCVVAGAVEEVDAFAERVRGRVPVRRLASRRAFHSVLIAPAAGALRAAAAQMRAGRPAVPVAAGASGTLIEAGAVYDPGGLVEQALRPVRFADALRAIAERYPGAVAVEVGPGRALSAMAARAGLDTVPLAPGGADPAVEAAEALGALWTMGQPLDLASLAGEGRCVRLPTYPFGGRRRRAREAEPAAAPAPPCGPQPRPDPAGDRADAGGAPGGEVAQVLEQVWAELLGHERPSPDDDFFRMGGDSLLVTRIAREAGRRLGIRIPVRDLLLGRTLGGQITRVRELAEHGRAIRGTD
ncbi:type I polyketide synthase [Nocardiopsis baichengensis]|uniref:type I polyketide synthase n=1 Tax=Nocardiopsis baichengensis TaxID=280240 RepID=UPI00034BCF5C|nr:type I polyketide synthase [Nocardiopsis baichengensis]